MKIAGKSFDIPCEDAVPIIRGDEVFNIVVKPCPPVGEFENICKRPTPPVIKKPNEPDQVNIKDANYVAALDKYSDLKVAWMVITSIKDTPDLTFDTIDLDDQSTWMNYIDEFKSSGLSDSEINRIIKGVFSINSLDQEKIEQARKNFLASRRQVLDKR